MAVGSFHRIPVCPVLLVHVSKDSWQLFQIGTDIRFVGAAFEQAAGDSSDLCSGNVVARLERSIRIACDPAALCRIGDGLCCPMRGRNVRKGRSSVRQLLKPAADRGKFRARDRRVWPERSVAVAADDPELLPVSGTLCL